MKKNIINQSTLLLVLMLVVGAINVVLTDYFVTTDMAESVMIVWPTYRLVTVCAVFMYGLNAVMDILNTHEVQIGDRFSESNIIKKYTSTDISKRKYLLIALGEFNAVLFSLFISYLISLIRTDAVTIADIQTVALVTGILTFIYITLHRLLALALPNKINDERRALHDLYYGCSSALGIIATMLASLVTQQYMIDVGLFVFLTSFLVIMVYSKMNRGDK